MHRGRPPGKIGKVQSGTFGEEKRLAIWLFGTNGTSKRCYFEKQTGEVAENKGKDYMDSRKQTGKRSGEVVENKFLWKKRTGANRKTNLPILLKIQGDKNSTSATQSTASPNQKG